MTDRLPPDELGGDPRLVGTVEDERDSRLYRRMCFIRRFEETLLRLFDEGLLNGTTHACIGQEANCVGVMENLRHDDHVFSNHRCHGHYLAKTGDARGLLAEMMGQPEGVCGGLGGSQHLCTDHFKSNGILGGTVPAAAGIAWAEQLNGGDRLSAAFIGDGTLGQGVVYETLNMAALWRLPLLVICEANEWAQSTSTEVGLAGSIRERFTAFGVPVTEIASTDVVEIVGAAAEAVTRCRERGPHVLLIHTYRLCHHSKNDDHRPSGEVERRWESEPLRVHGVKLPDSTKLRIEGEVEAALSEIVTALRGAS